VAPALDLTTTPRRRRLLFALLYLAEGAPIGFLWWTLPVLLGDAGWSLAASTALGATLALPWTLKVLGAPFVDLARSSGVPLRWIVVGAQALMAATLLPLTAPGALGALDALTWLLVLHACAAAMQDVAVDALCLAVTPEEERGRVNGWMQAGMLLGRGGISAGGLHLASALGPEAPVVLLCALLVAVAVVALLVIPSGAGARSVPSPLRAAWGALASVVRSRSTWRALCFALVAGAGFEAAGAVAGRYLRDHGWAKDALATWFEIPKVVLMAVGALLGGRAADRCGAAGAAGRSLALLTAAVLAVAALDMLGMGGHALALVLWNALYLAIGLFTASSYAWLMAHTSPDLAATQFSAYMSATNACEVWASFAVGRLVGPLGYGPALAALAVVGLCAAPLLRRASTP
jgi:hypothetical protein